MGLVVSRRIRGFSWCWLEIWLIALVLISQDSSVEGVGLSYYNIGARFSTRRVVGWYLSMHGEKLEHLWEGFLGRN